MEHSTGPVAVAVLDDIPPDHDQPRGTLAAVREWGVVLAVALGVALLVRGFLIAPFYIPSTSMVETLQVKDRILVNRLSYRLHDVNRGDVIVFEKPPDAQFGDEVEDLIKRAIGLPGDTLEIRDCRVYVSGQLLDEPYTLEKCTNGPASTATDPEQDGTIVVPEGKYFVMGDNRTGSSDSRVWGFVDEEQIIGRAFVIIWPRKNWAWL